MSLLSSSFPESIFGLHAANKKTKIKRSEIIFMAVFELKIIKRKNYLY